MSMEAEAVDTGAAPATEDQYDAADDQDEEDADDDGRRRRPMSPPSPPIQMPQTAQLGKGDEIKMWPVSALDSKKKKKKGTLGIGNALALLCLRERQDARPEDQRAPRRKPLAREGQDAPSPALARRRHGRVHARLPLRLQGRRRRDRAQDRDEQGHRAHRIHRTSCIHPSRSPAPPIAAAAAIPPPPPAPPAPAASLSTAHTHRKRRAPASRPQDRLLPVAAGSARKRHKRRWEHAIAMYDFEAQGDDELTVAENEHLVILEREKRRLVEGAQRCRPRRPRLFGPRSLPSRRRTNAFAREEEEAEAVAEAERQREAAEAAQRAQETARKGGEGTHATRGAQGAACACTSKLTQRPSTTEVSRAAKNVAIPQGRSAPERPKDAGGRSKPSPNNTRIWTDRTGQFKVEAEFLGFNQGKIRLHKMKRRGDRGGCGKDVQHRHCPSSRTLRARSSIRPTTRSLRPPAPAAASANASASAQMSRSQASTTGGMSREERERERERRKEKEREQRRREQSRTGPKRNVDWFEFFLAAGVDVDDCTRYASAFERDKIDETVLGDLDASTLRSLGLREGDVIRVSKFIDRKYRRDKTTSSRQSSRARAGELGEARRHGEPCAAAALLGPGRHAQEQHAQGQAHAEEHGRQQCGCGVAGGSERVAGKDHLAAGASEHCEPGDRAQAQRLGGGQRLRRRCLDAASAEHQARHAGASLGSIACARSRASGTHTAACACCRCVAGRPELGAVRKAGGDEAAVGGCESAAGREPFAGVVVPGTVAGVQPECAARTVCARAGQPGPAAAAGAHAGHRPVCADQDAAAADGLYGHAAADDGHAAAADRLGHAKHARHAGNAGNAAADDGLQQRRHVSHVANGPDGPDGPDGDAASANRVWRCGRLRVQPVWAAGRGERAESAADDGAADGLWHGLAAAGAATAAAAGGQGQVQRVQHLPADEERFVCQGPQCGAADERQVRCAAPAADWLPAGWSHASVHGNGVRTAAAAATAVRSEWLWWRLWRLLSSTHAMPTNLCMRWAWFDPCRSMRARQETIGAAAAEAGWKTRDARREAAAIEPSGNCNDDRLTLICCGEKGSQKKRARPKCSWPRRAKLTLWGWGSAGRASAGQAAGGARLAGAVSVCSWKKSRQPPSSRRRAPQTNRFSNPRAAAPPQPANQPTSQPNTSRQTRTFHSNVVLHPSSRAL
ncbi:hypothetical protein L1887_62746 [Cichorium endivia]|nr:hypothetical protein L1887_62746 [Cichorium endivia]